MPNTRNAPNPARQFDEDKCERIAALRELQAWLLQIEAQRQAEQVQQIVVFVRLLRGQTTKQAA